MDYACDLNSSDIAHGAQARSVSVSGQHDGSTLICESIECVDTERQYKGGFDHLEESEHLAKENSL